MRSDVVVQSWNYGTTTGKKRRVGRPHRGEETTITAFGETKTVNEWCRERNIDHSTLYNRIFNHKWTPEEALSKPKRKISPEERLKRRRATMRKYGV